MMVTEYPVLFIRGTQEEVERFLKVIDPEKERKNFEVIILGVSEFLIVPKEIGQYFNEED